MGTYYTELSDASSCRVEEANIENEDLILKIHNDYILSGAKLIRTNTFAANSISLETNFCRVKEIINKACNIANKAASDRNVYISGNIGPIPEVLSDGTEVSKSEIISEYRDIVDCFIDNNITIFNLETFSSVEFINEIISYIKSKVKSSFILVQFSISKSGYSRQGIHFKELISTLKNADFFGFNCGSGPTHLLNNIKKLNNDYSLSFYPNAGYPEIVNHRTVFNSSPSYFANKILESLEYGVKIVGGCCGTTPEYIKMIATKLGGDRDDITIKIDRGKSNHISQNVIKKDLIIAVEIDPPFTPDLSKVIRSARELKEAGASFITVADSPSGRMRLNPIMVASRIKRDVGIDVMPHICCRDRNLIALKSDILAAHTESIRKILLITGDPIPQEERDIVKKVFNCNSVTLMKQVTEFNKTILSGSEFTIGGALNLSSRNIDVQINKMKSKIEAGATLFLTQPIYDDVAINHLLNIKKSHSIKILAGIMPIVTYKNAQFLNNEFPGITIPDELINRFSSSMSREEAQRVGIEIAVNTVNKLKHVVDGFYFITPFFRTEMIKEIISNTLF